MSRLQVTPSTRIAVRLPNALGDAVMAAPMLARLASAVGEGKLTLVGPSAAIAVLDGGPWVGETIVLDKSLRRGIKGHFKLAARLRALKLDAVVCLPNSMGSLLPFWLAKIPHRVGYAKEGRRWMLTASLKRPLGLDGRYLPGYTGQRFSDLLELMDGLPSGSGHPRLYVTEKGEAEAATWRASSGLQEGEPYLIVVPGAAFGWAKLWLPERYAEVADELARKHKARVLISYGPGEEGIVAAVKSYMKTTPLPDAKVSIDGLKSIFKRAAFALTNDTGPRHLAVAFDIPSVTIMGPNDPRFTHLDSERTIVARVDVPCSPCQRKTCPLAERICMTRLESSAVLAAAERMWPQ